MLACFIMIATFLILKWQHQFGRPVCPTLVFQFYFSHHFYVMLLWSVFGAWFLPCNLKDFSLHYRLCSLFPSPCVHLVVCIGATLSQQMPPLLGITSFLSDSLQPPVKLLWGVSDKYRACTSCSALYKEATQDAEEKSGGRWNGGREPVLPSLAAFKFLGWIIRPSWPRLFWGETVKPSPLPRTSPKGALWVPHLKMHLIPGSKRSF